MAEVQKFRSSEVQKFRSSEVQKFRSSEVQKFRSSEVQKFRSSEDCTDSTKLVKACRYKNIPARLDKKKGSEFATADEHRIMNVNADVSSTVTARYYKGLSAHGDNLVIVKVLYE